MLRPADITESNLHESHFSQLAPHTQYIPLPKCPHVHRFICPNVHWSKCPFVCMSSYLHQSCPSCPQRPSTEGRCHQTFQLKSPEIFRAANNEHLVGSFQIVTQAGNHVIATNMLKGKSLLFAPYLIKNLFDWSFPKVA